MSRLILYFVKEWIEEQRKNGKRVIRQLEKWIASVEGAVLKMSSDHGLTLELPPAEREKFLKDLGEQLKNNFGETDPWAHVTFSGDINGLDVPVARREAEQKGKSQPEEKVTAEKKQSDEQPALPEQQETPETVSLGEVHQSEPKGKILAEEKLTTEKKQGSEPISKQEQQEMLETLCRQVPIRYSRELEAYVRETAEVIPMLQKMGAESTLWHQHLLLAIDAGYGRSEFLNILVQLYKNFGLVKGEIDKKAVREYILLPKGKEGKEDGYRVTWNTVLEAAQDMDRSNTRNGLSKAVLYVDVSEWQSLLATTEGKIRLRRLNSLCGTFLIVFRVPFLEGHVLRETADALNDILNVRTIAVPPAPAEAMIDYARGELTKSGFQLADNALGSFEQLLLREKVDGSFFGYKTMNKIVQKLIYDKALANCRRKEKKSIIDIDDFEVASSAETDNKHTAELKKMVGMEAVAQRLNEVIVQIKTQKKLEEQGKTVARPAIHMLFTGNPGTGKTTVARILAGMMHQAGILRKGHLVEVKGRDLCGQYVGETAPKTSAICRDAYGSVLFIDEAYSLFRDDYSSARDYGREALDTLVAEMDNHRDDLCVIMAGYKEEMEAMLKGNVGLSGRIPYIIEFPNYTRDELEKIFFTMLDGVFDYEETLKEAVHEFFADIPEETFLSKEFSNARLVRNLYERTWGKAAYRQSLEGGDLRILKSDLVGAMADGEFKKLLKKNTERTTIGFNV